VKSGTSKKQLAKIQHELKGVKAAAKAEDQTKHPATKEYDRVFRIFDLLL
jgi:hypothetical protein